MVEACMGEMRNAYTVLDREPERKRPRGRSTVQAGYLGSIMRDERGGRSEGKKVSVRVW
jgi:hypothetical protein